MSTNSQTPPTESHPVFISSRFNPDSWDMQDADTLLLTPDQVFFYVHGSVLLRHSSNFFGGLLFGDAASFDDCNEVDISRPMKSPDLLLNPESSVVVVNTPSDVLNIVLLSIYQLPIQEFAPRNEALLQVVPTLTSLGYDPGVIACPGSELYGLLLKLAATNPLPMYAIAAQFSFESLAVAVSALTLQTPLHEITDELSQQMGPLYLRRLFFLHVGRAAALKRIVLPLPALHPPQSSPRCDAEAQKGLQRAWTLASAHIISQNHPGGVDDMVSLLGRRIKCAECGRSLQERVSRLVHDWSAVKYTI